MAIVTSSEDSMHFDSTQTHTHDCERGDDYHCNTFSAQCLSSMSFYPLKYLARSFACMFVREKQVLRVPCRTCPPFEICP
jgi:hypothetical protein